MLTKEQKQAIRDAACQEFYKNGTTEFPDAIAAAIKVYDEQVNGKTNDKFTNAIDVVQTLRQSLNLTECQKFNIKRVLAHLEFAKNDAWEHAIGEADTRIEIKVVMAKNSKTKSVKSFYIKDNGTLCIELN